MSPDKENPCKYGLTPECFEEYPEFAKQAFAIRLLCLLVDCEITSKLPGKLGKLLSIPKWGPGYPWPDAPFWWDTITMPEIADTGPLAPWHLGTSPWGPWSMPRKGPSKDYYFYDHFVTVTDNNWLLTPPISGGTLTISGTNLLFNQWTHITTASSKVDIVDPPGNNFDIIFSLWYSSGYNYMYVLFDTGVYYIQLYFDFPDSVRLRTDTGFETIAVLDYEAHTDAWKMEIRGDQVTLYQSHHPYLDDWVQRGSTYTLQAVSLNPHQIKIFFWDLGVIYMDYFIIDNTV